MTQQLNENYTSILKGYTSWLETLGFSDAVVYNYTCINHSFLIWLQDQSHAHISCLSTKLIFNYFSYLETRPHKKIIGKGLSSSLLNKSFDAIDKFCEFLNHMGMDSAPVPTKYRLEKKREKPIQVLSFEEIQLLYKAIPNTFSAHTFSYSTPRKSILHLILDMCYGCGLRRGELFKLALKDVNLDKRILHIRGAKGYKDRYVPMSKNIYSTTQDFIYNHRRYWNKRPGMLFPYSHYNALYLLKELQREVSCENLRSRTIGLHSLRHSIATHLLQNKMPIEQIAIFLGHSSLDSTQIYTHLKIANEI